MYTGSYRNPEYYSVLEIVTGNKINTIVESIIKANNAIKEHSHTSGNDGVMIGTTSIIDESIIDSKIGTGAVTVNKIGALAVTEAKIGTGAVTVNKIGALAVTGVKIDSAVAGLGLSKDVSGNLQVNVDNSTLEIDSDALRAKDGGISTAKLAKDVLITEEVYTAAFTDGGPGVPHNSKLITAVGKTKVIFYLTLNYHPKVYHNNDLGANLAWSYDNWVSSDYIYVQLVKYDTAPSYITVCTAESLTITLLNGESVRYSFRSNNVSTLRVIIIKNVS